MIKRIARKIKKTIAGQKPIIDISNEYIEWLKFANAGMLERGNLYSFDYAIKNLPSENPIIEIGSFCGLSTNIMGYYLQKHKRQPKIITADKWLFEGSELGDATLGDSTIAHSDYRNFIKESYIRNIKMFSPANLPYTVEQLSDDFFKLWESNANVTDVLGRSIQLGGKISFAYIDGNHTYEFTKRDFMNTDKFLEKGGFILFDDSSDEVAFGSAEVMAEILNNPHYELIIKNPNYLFRKIR